MWRGILRKQLLEFKSWQCDILRLYSELLEAKYHATISWGWLAFARGAAARHRKMIEDSLPTEENLW